MAEAVANGLVPTVYTRAEESLRPSRAAAATGRKVDVHLKVDTGMHRVGADPAEMHRARARRYADRRTFVSDRCGRIWRSQRESGDEDRNFTSEQIRLYDEVLARLQAAGIDVPLRHAANSAGAIAHPASRYDMVRCGIAIYGELPAPELGPVARAAGETLLPVMSLKARVVLVRELHAGERPSYGRRRALSEDSVVAVMPIGYADGVPRAWFDRHGTVLVGGQRRPLAGTVTMDQIVVDCGRNSGVGGRGRGGADRSPGRSEPQGLGLGGDARHHQLRGVVRHRAEGDACSGGGLGADPEEHMTMSTTTHDEHHGRGSRSEPAESGRARGGYRCPRGRGRTGGRLGRPAASRLAVFCHRSRSPGKSS